MGVGRLKTATLVVGALVIAAIVVHMALSEQLLARHPMRSLRQLTIWNLFLTGIFLMLVPVLAPRPLLMVGLAVACLNVFVLSARSALLPFRAARSAVWWSLDILTHYLIPLTAVGLLLAVWREGGQVLVSPFVWQALLIFIAVLVAWFLFNLLLYSINGTWAYGQRVGHVRHMTPKDGAALGASVAGSFGLVMLITWGVLRQPKKRVFGGVVVHPGDVFLRVK